MARLSHTTTSSSTRTGTLPTGEYRFTRSLKSGALKLIFSSSNGMPGCFKRSQARSDQLE
jgi:hypothetical protein